MKENNIKIKNLASFLLLSCASHVHGATDLLTGDLFKVNPMYACPAFISPSLPLNNLDLSLEADNVRTDLFFQLSDPWNMVQEQIALLNSYNDTKQETILNPHTDEANTVISEQADLDEDALVNNTIFK